jgi:cation transport regulator ChaB
VPQGQAREEAEPLPLTLQRSPKKAQETYLKALENAHRTYDGNEQGAHRAAWAAVKHLFERVGDHWEPKPRPGPSDPRAERGGPHASGPTFRGVDVEGKTKEQLLEEARRLGARANTHMTKFEIAKAIERRNEEITREARERGRVRRKQAR